MTALTCVSPVCSRAKSIPAVTSCSPPSSQPNCQKSAHRSPLHGSRLDTTVLLPRLAHTITTWCGSCCSCCPGCSPSTRRSRRRPAAAPATWRAVRMSRLRRSRLDNAGQGKETFECSNLLGLPEARPQVSVRCCCCPRGRAGSDADLSQVSTYTSSQCSGACRRLISSALI